MGTSNKRRGKSNKSTNVTLDVQTYSAGGSFLKLEQVNIEMMHLESCMVVSDLGLERLSLGISSAQNMSFRKIK